MHLLGNNAGLTLSGYSIYFKHIWLAFLFIVNKINPYNPPAVKYPVYFYGSFPNLFGNSVINFCRSNFFACTKVFGLVIEKILFRDDL